MYYPFRTMPRAPEICCEETEVRTVVDEAEERWRNVGRDVTGYVHTAAGMSLLTIEHSWAASRLGLSGLIRGCDG
jgi:hypothetical protein